MPRWFQRLGAIAVVVLLSGCGISLYPGQPGMKTSGSVKIEMEDIQFEGTYVYEASYDNSKDGAGVGAIVTRLYPGARTFTSNVRTNADGTVFRGKTPYEGGRIDLISIPSQNKLIYSPESQIAMLVDYEFSLDEIDVENIAEKKLFSTESVPPSQANFSRLKLLFRLMRAGSFESTGKLSYDVEKVVLGDKTFQPSVPLTIQSNLWMTGFRTQVASETRQKMVEFVEGNFPKGYRGSIDIYLKGTQEPFTVRAGIHTRKTAETSGKKVSTATAAEMKEILKNIGFSN